MIYHKGATQLDQCAHRLMEFNLSPDWHGSTVVGDYIAYYHEEKLFTVRHLKKGVSCLVYARSPYDAIEKVRAIDAGDVMEDLANVRPVVRGHWIGTKEAEDMGDIMKEFTCSVCGCCEWDCTESESFNFCPKCGADMRGTDDEKA